MQWHDPSHQKCPVSSSFLASVIFMILPTVNYPTHDPTHGKFVFIMPPTLELGCWAFFDVFRNLIHSVFPFISSFRDNCMSSLQFHCKDNKYLCSLKVDIYIFGQYEYCLHCVLHSSPKGSYTAMLMETIGSQFGSLFIYIKRKPCQGRGRAKGFRDNPAGGASGTPLGFCSKSPGWCSWAHKSPPTLFASINCQMSFTFCWKFYF